MALTDKLTAIADAIRAKTGKTESLTLDQMPTEISSITTGGGSSEDVRYVTFMNGDVELYRKPVAVGDDCVDVVAKGLIPAPTKESTAQYNYTYYGWGAEDGGAADADILKNITEDKTVYAIYTSSVRYYTITYLDDDGVTVLKTEQLAYGAMPSYAPKKGGYVLEGWMPSLSKVVGNSTYTAVWVEMALDRMTWQEISEISAAGTGENYFSIGDTKAVHLSGRIGTISLDTTLYAFIIGFNHNSELEGTGIHFCGFKTESGTNGVDVCLTDSAYYTEKTGGTKYFNMNHWGRSNCGGWAGCDMRYDILGSTDVAPSGYGAIKTENTVGYDATNACATNPVAYTLMSCLPGDLRAVMKPITKYSDNVGGETALETNITASVDYLPLLSAFEISGSTTLSNVYEKNHQKQYSYYVGKSLRRFKHSETGSAVCWWTRSAWYGNWAGRFNHVAHNGGVASYYADISEGIAPIFMV